MAFDKVAGYGNLPNGNFSPTIYSKMAQIAFRKTNVVQEITNSDYFGDIAEFGDTVKIIKEPNVSVSSYVRGKTVSPQDLQDDEIVLTIDKANSFSFKVDDIETKQAHLNWESMATDRAAYQLATEYDREVLEYMTTQVGITDGEVSYAAHKIGTTANPIEVVTDGSEDNSASFSALSLLARFQRLLDEANVPGDQRWLVADPVFYEKLSDENSKILNNDYTEKGILRNGMVSEGELRGFKLYKSNNLLKAGSGPSGTSSSDYGWILAGHMSSTATAEQINKVESFRSTDSFADIVRGLHMYGRKVLRPEGLVGAIYHSPSA